MWVLNSVTSRSSFFFTFFFFFSQTVTDQSIIKIAEKCLQLKQLCVSKCPDLTDNTLLSLAQHNRSCLSTLEVAGCNQFTDLGFQALGRVSLFVCLLIILTRWQEMGLFFGEIIFFTNRPLLQESFYFYQFIEFFLFLLYLELQIFGTNGSGRMQSNNWFHTCALSHGMSEFRKIGKNFTIFEMKTNNRKKNCFAFLLCPVRLYHTVN